MWKSQAIQQIGNQLFNLLLEGCLNVFACLFYFIFFISFQSLQTTVATWQTNRCSLTLLSMSAATQDVKAWVKSRFRGLVEKPPVNTLSVVLLHAPCNRWAKLDFYTNIPLIYPPFIFTSKILQNRECEISKATLETNLTDLTNKHSQPGR